MMRNPLWMVALGAAAMLSCTDTGTQGPTLNSNTNWLMACSADENCADGLSCLCGQCTQECTDVTDCSEDGAECIVNAVTCESAPVAACLPGCTDDEDCGDGYNCALGDTETLVCVPAWADDGTTGCVGGWQFHCGSTIGGARDALFECENGSYTRVETCEGACISTGEANAFCTPDCGEPGLPVCGDATNGGDPDTLYACREGNLTWVATCVYGCGLDGDRAGCMSAP